ncbi:MAG: Gfo/Idh/MocA family oxidoreductase, partial [Planctomycetes bacterium]|nr:Gfo/Idh/MocA family oxidoreductase [Planctomycetota bacterium]
NSKDVQAVAVCDVDTNHRNRARDAVNEKYGNQDCAAYNDFRDLVAREDIDAVTIGTPDHWHALTTVAAANAGKDVYCEKPLAMDFEKLKSACDAVKAADVVCQIGTQVRSYPTSTACHELYKKGVLGKISRIEQSRNSVRPYWYSRIAEAKEKEVDWKEFLMHRSPRPFRADHFTGWYGVRDFSDGPIPGLASHFVDLIHYITGAKFPQSVVAQAGIFSWDDAHEFSCPDQVEATWIYPEGFMVNYTTNFGNSNGNRIHFYGQHGTLDMTPWSAPKISGAGAMEKGELGAETPVEPIETPDHFLDWLQCIRTRGTCRASIDAGYQHAVAVLMAVCAHDTGHRQIYDPENREIRDG